MEFLTSPTRVLFFTGKGGVGKTSVACAAAVKLADAGKRVLLISTDPASNLDEVLGVTLGNAPTAGARRPEPEGDEHRPGGVREGVPGEHGGPVPRGAAGRGGGEHGGAVLRVVHPGDRRVRRVRPAPRRHRDRRATSTTSCSTRPRPGTRCGCSRCRPRGTGSCPPTRPAPRAWGRSRGSRPSRSSTPTRSRPSAIRRRPPSSSSPARMWRRCARPSGPAANWRPSAFGTSTSSSTACSGRSRRPTPSPVRWSGERRRPCRGCRWA